MKKLLLKIYVFVCVIFILTNVSYGYLDPSAMTYLIQVTAAIVIGIGTSIGVFFYKIKRFFKKKNKDVSNEKTDEVNDNIIETSKDNIEK